MAKLNTLNPFSALIIKNSSLSELSSYEDQIDLHNDSSSTPASQSYRELLVTLDQLSATLASIRKVTAESAGLTPPQFNILLSLGESVHRTGVSVGEVASILSVTAAFVTVEANKLVESGFIMKTPNPNDRRSIHLKLTNQGRQYVSEIMPILESHHKEVFEHVSSKEISKIQKVIDSTLSQSQNLLFNMTAYQRNAKKT